MEQLINDPNTIAMIVAIVLAVNFTLSGIHKALEVIKDKTKTDVDNKAAEVLGKFLSVLQKLVDWVGPRTAKQPSDEAPK